MFYSHNRLLTAICILLFAFAANAQDTVSYREYIDRYANLAIEQQALYGIPASITLAQGLLESDCGKSVLATTANNHFGIKCGGTWNGPSMAHDDDAPQECFRSYESVEQSYVDHSLFLLERPRYKSLFLLDAYDYKGWATGLKAAGYATNPTYAEQLIKIIEDNQLYKYDTALLTGYVGTVDTPAEQAALQAEEKIIAAVAVASEEPVRKVDVDNLTVSVYRTGDYGIVAENGTRYVIAREGDTLSNIAKSLGVPESYLRRINGLKSDATLTAGNKIFVESKPK